MGEKVDDMVGKVRGEAILTAIDESVVVGRESSVGVTLPLEGHAGNAL